MDNLPNICSSISEAIRNIVLEKPISLSDRYLGIFRDFDGNASLFNQIDPFASNILLLSDFKQFREKFTEHAITEYHGGL